MCVCVCVWVSVFFYWLGLFRFDFVESDDFSQIRWIHENSVFIIKIVAFRRKKCCYNDFRFEVSRNTTSYKNEPNYVKFCLGILILIEIVNFVTKNDIMKNCALKITRNYRTKNWLRYVTQFLYTKIESDDLPDTLNFSTKLKIFDVKNAATVISNSTSYKNELNYVKFGLEILILIRFATFRHKNRKINTENCSSKITQEMLSDTKTPSYSKLWNEKLISVSHAAFAQEIWRRILLWYHWLTISHRYVEFRYKNSVFIKIVVFRRKNRCYSDFGFENKDIQQKI